jgi:hypothetical protein
VYGDLLNTDTRNILTVLLMTEVKYHFKENNRSSGSDIGMGQEINEDESLGKTSTPVIEDIGFKRLGSGHQLLEFCTSKDQRNAPKKDEKGKLIKPKKGVPPAKTLNPKDLKETI